MTFAILSQRIQDIIQSPVPLNTMGAIQWQDMGLSDDEICMVVQHTMDWRNANQKPTPYSLKFFDRAILKAVEDKKRFQAPSMTNIAPMATPTQTAMARAKTLQSDFMARWVQDNPHASLNRKQQATAIAWWQAQYIAGVKNMGYSAIDIFGTIPNGDYLDEYLKYLCQLCNDSKGLINLPPELPPLREAVSLPDNANVA